MHKLQFIKKTFICAAFSVALGFTGCGNQPEVFRVNGYVEGASGKMLYLEMRNIRENMIVDSCKLDADGRFAFERPRPEYPEFYALKLNNQHVFFAIDSTETLTFKAHADNFPTNYEVEGSENAQKIRELCLLQHNAQQQVNTLLKSNLPQDSLSKAIVLALNAYKQEAIRYILSSDIASAKSTAAYFAIFQRINDYLIFDLYNERDNRFFAALATSYDLAYPKSPRTLHLKMLTLQAKKAIQQEKNLRNLKAEYTNNIEIELPTISGEPVKLSSTTGKVVLLDFTAYTSDFSPARTLDLRKLYDKFKDKGLEIYQVSLDASENFWK
ncbi:MAG: DUF4369 domain-containing protein, partial [Bacteroidales bacterium]|nr:DUF4369 domain-containing protein [Bacteroidales bacterium]